jgi:sterol 3beta-glucosyltransferase
MAVGLIAGCPTTVVPFFGDQPFWGAACTRMGVGPKPIPIDKLDTPSLVEALRFMMRPEVQAAATETGQGIKHVSQLLQHSQKLLCRQSLVLCCNICTV